MCRALSTHRPLQHPATRLFGSHATITPQDNGLTSRFPLTRTTCAAGAANITPSITSTNTTQHSRAGPEAAGPEVAEPEVAEPEVAEPEVAEPEAAEPEAAEPEAAEPEAAEL